VVLHHGRSTGKSILNLLSLNSFGFRSPEILEMALYHALGKLPEPELAHAFY
jgi:hypothetical protein